MKKLINIIKITEQILFFLRDITYQEHNILLDSKDNIAVMLQCIGKDKKILIKKLLSANKNRCILEKKYNIFKPYVNKPKLKKVWENIVDQSLILKELNFKNKKLLNHRMYLNQHFLDLLNAHNKKIIYNVDGNLESQ
ncbi:flagellar biosynthesis protein FlgN [Buchnera aphidicola (Muscaphis stroyani)]|uniref:Flagellar biosynthesis protein FlgN n=1 Tax=Buchnera aphidicola (Muscaphis stroyani) TaxID=1241869 RepID=A0A4D6YCW5_9GAMM|nr:flagellar export chaperone FlgN [Buchnera aphidicola]QCI24401.1 flagellar biosynthesis protein FlgN [Buchnera aphidicola (Muscaphis stroyani)]